MGKNWTARGTAGHESHGQWAVYDDAGKDVAIVYDGPRDGNLIAAAPQLLEACKAILASFHESVRTEKAIDEFPALKAVDAAIRAAEGGGV